MFIRVILSTDLWKEILRKKDPEMYTKYNSRSEAPRSWRKVYMVSPRVYPLTCYRAGKKWNLVETDVETDHIPMPSHRHPKPYPGSLQKVLEKESQRRANAAEHMKMLYQQEASRKSERIVTVLEGPVNPSVIGGRGWNFGRRGGGSAAGELL
jgi:hypothetical protein